MFLEQQIRMISEGSCDTEDWSNDAENSALITEINYILKYIKMEVILNCNISNDYCFFLVIISLSLIYIYIYNFWPYLILTSESVISAMEFHEKLHDMAMKEGLKGRKLHKSIESFTWNITILKVITAETPVKNSAPIWDDDLHIFYHKRILTLRCASYDFKMLWCIAVNILNI